MTWFATLYFYLNNDGTPKAQGQALLTVQATRGERVPAWDSLGDVLSPSSQGLPSALE